jgi:hypothetical protein
MKIKITGMYGREGEREREREREREINKILYIHLMYFFNFKKFIKIIKIY